MDRARCSPPECAGPLRSGHMSSRARLRRSIPMPDLATSHHSQRENGRICPRGHSRTSGSRSCRKRKRLSSITSVLRCVADATTTRSALRPSPRRDGSVLTAAPPRSSATPYRAMPIDAAFANCTQMRSYGLDDVVFPAGIHAGLVTIPSRWPWLKSVAARAATY